ncbi:hypothetical protein RRG08_020163 [Elysia crispata]|uniref:Uncharacterized protein n=1 Tax=Elysia crispata TaxID=231223 RepID=A0AAE0YY92_9GAST|nr:hypothetical protein RRG08_020163 [Elysia crispata]
MTDHRPYHSYSVELREGRSEQGLTTGHTIPCRATGRRNVTRDLSCNPLIYQRHLGEKPALVTHSRQVYFFSLTPSGLSFSQAGREAERPSLEEVAMRRR